MYKYIGLLQTGPADGFMLNGNSSLHALARFYGLKPPASEPTATVADYLARSCYGQPRIGDRAVWERVELVIEEMHDRSISKVRLALLPLHERRESRAHPELSSGLGTRERRGAERRA